MLREGGRTRKRLKKLLQPFYVPRYVSNHGVLLPTRYPLLTKGIRRQIYFGEYESKEAEIVSRRLEKDDVVMEVGAGIGFLSALCARRIGSEKVFAYEANPALFELIAMTHRINGVAPVVENAILGKENGERLFYLEKEFWASSTTVKTNAQAILVSQKDLNSELAKRRPTFLIVDIEGGEKEFFAVANLDTVRKICIETHPGILSNEEITDLFELLFRQGFVLDFSLIRKNVFYLYRPSDAQ